MSVDITLPEGGPHRAVRILSAGKVLAEIVASSVIESAPLVADVDAAREAMTLLRLMAKVTHWDAFSAGVTGRRSPHPYQGIAPIVVVPDSVPAGEKTKWDNDFHVGELAARLIAACKTPDER